MPPSIISSTLFSPLVISTTPSTHLLFHRSESFYVMNEVHHRKRLLCTLPGYHMEKVNYV